MKRAWNIIKCVITLYSLLGEYIYIYFFNKISYDFEITHVCFSTHEGCYRFYVLLLPLPTGQVGMVLGSCICNLKTAVQRSL